MRRVLALVLPAALLVVPAFVPPAAEAAAPITGRVFEHRTNSVVPNAIVQLREVNGDDTVGSVVATTTTSSTGDFSLVPPEPADADYWVEVLTNNRIQRGLVDDNASGASWLQANAEYADQIAPGTNVGRVNALSSYLRGKVVNAANGNPLRGVTVTVRDVVRRRVIIGSAVTNRDGFYRIRGLEVEELAVRVNGSARGFETGWVGWHLNVYPTWGQAASVGTGPLGKVKLNHL